MSDVLYKVMKVPSEQALLVSRYLIEQPNKDGKVLFSQDQAIKRKELKSKLDKLIPGYTFYNGFAMTSLLSRLTSILDETKNEIQEKLRDADDEGIGEVPLKVIYKVFKELYVPEFDEDIKEFFEYLLFRQSDSLDAINYYAFLDIFDEDYLIEPSPHEDKDQICYSSETSLDPDEIQSTNQQ